MIKPDRSHYFSVDVFLCCFSISVRAGVMNQVIFKAPITPRVLPTCCEYLLVHRFSLNTKETKVSTYATIIALITLLVHMYRKCILIN